MGKRIIVPLMIIALCLMTGFTKADDELQLRDCLIQRTEIMQSCFCGEISEGAAEVLLQAIETYPLLTDDVKALRDWEAADIDMVRSMAVLSPEKQHEIFGYITYRATIIWDMQGIPDDYVLESEYHIVLKRIGDKIKLSSLEPVDQ